MGHYRSNLRDVEFNLFEVFRVQDRFGRGPYAQMDLDTARQVLREVERVAAGPFADSFVEGDRTPVRLENGTVHLPEGIKRSLDAFFHGEWFRLQLPEHLGGVGAPPSLSWSATAFLLGANPAALLYTAGPFFATILDRLVTDDQRRRWIVPMVERMWGATMVLTEPDAGSDVGAGRTSAVHAGDGVWHITGIKRFITNGDFDWPENILHLVLARPEGHGPGTKGLSLFIVPKFWLNNDGSPGERNGVVVTRLEDKMGIKASATCELAFGLGDVPARGLLVGEVHDGIAQMFKVIEYARMLVGTKAIETLSTGYLGALAFARQRVQGPDLAQATDKTAPRVAIIRHPDVRRSLMTQKAHVEGMRALMMYTASIQDQILLHEAPAPSGARDGDAGLELDALRRRNDLLLPLVKGYGSERSYALLADALQVLGGSGYCRDYPHEQYIRDAKIDTLYEGTTGIQGMDLFFRKIAREQGATLTALLADIKETAKGDTGNGALAAERQALLRAVGEVESMLATLVEFFSTSVYLIGLSTTPFLFTVAELVIAWLMIRQSEVALDALQAEHDPKELAFYHGKVAATRWFCRTVLPQFSARREILSTTNLSVMELPDGAW